MKLFQCQSCGHVVYFENHTCGQCGHALAYLPDRTTLSALEPAQNGAFVPLAAQNRSVRLCDNARHGACNWLVDDGSAEIFCQCCRHNGTIPDLSDPARLTAWQSIETAKHRLFYSLLRFALPLRTRAEDPAHGLQFDVLADAPSPQGPKVMTGHDDGLITIALAEADDVERERRRASMGEPYRTLIGHFRHEVGHHYWDVLVRDRGKLDACRSVFGDDRADYGEALQRHYREGAPADWQERFVSNYATAHPWEDFAETWAHYLHIVDALETGAAYGFAVRPRVDTTGAHSTRIDFDPYRPGDVQQIVDAWLPFVLAMNDIARSLGQRDLYPFVLSPTVIGKLGFIHDLVHGRV